MFSTNTALQKIKRAVYALLILAPFCFVSAQTIKVAPVIDKTKIKIQIRQDDSIPAEKSIAVDAKVNISLCVKEGNLKINGWDRSEIRAFVDKGSAVDFNILQKNRQNNAVWVMVTGAQQSRAGKPVSEECLSGEEIELDVPRGATVNVKGRTTETKISMVRKVSVKNIGGDIFLNHIEEGIQAGTYEGDVMVENSGGAITLESSNGNIMAFDVAPSEIGDIFKAKTSSGAIMLQQIEHRQNEVSSTSGSIRYVGAFQSGGQYNLSTTNGTISLIIPEKSSCRINASFGFGVFDSGISLQNIVKSSSTKTQSLTAMIGTGDANVNLTTYSGAIRIKKQ